VPFPRKRIVDPPPDGLVGGVLQIDVRFDPEITDLESLATAADNLLSTALSTPGILDEYGNPEFGEFLPEPPIRAEGKKG